MWRRREESKDAGAAGRNAKLTLAVRFLAVFCTFLVPHPRVCPECARLSRCNAQPQRGEQTVWREGTAGRAVREVREGGAT